MVETADGEDLITHIQYEAGENRERGSRRKGACSPRDGVGKDVSLDSKLHGVTLHMNMLSMSSAQVRSNTGIRSESGMKGGLPVTCIHSGWCYEAHLDQEGKGVVVVVGVVESVEEAGFTW